MGIVRSTAWVVVGVVAENVGLMKWLTGWLDPPPAAEGGKEFEMSNTIDLRQAVNVDLPGLRGVAEKFADQMKGEYGIIWRWQDDAIMFDCPSGLAKGTRGSVQLEPSAVHVQISLPFMLQGAKPKIEAGVKEKLAKLA